MFPILTNIYIYLFYVEKKKNKSVVKPPDDESEESTEEDLPTSDVEESVVDDIESKCKVYIEYSFISNIHYRVREKIQGLKKNH